MKKFWVGVVASAVALATSSQATVYVNDDFSTFANGNLVGQSGWYQALASATLPVQVNNGLVVVPGGQTADNQDVGTDIGAGIAQPLTGTATVYISLSLIVTSAAPNTVTSPSYMMATYTSTGAGGFANFRFTARSNTNNLAGTYVLGGRITGQGTDPFTFGTTALNFGDTNTVLIEENDVAGTGSSYMRIFVNPTDLSTPYLTHVIGAGASDPTGIGSFIISQFTNSQGFELDHVTIADTFAEVVPSPQQLGW